MTVENIVFSQNTLGCIIRALTDLQRFGGRANDDLWLLGKSHDNAAKLPAFANVLRPELLDALTTMRRIEEISLMFHELAQSCERKLRSLKKELRSSFMHCGIQVLPKEVLEHIFELVVDDNDNASSTGPEVRLSHISSRFRSVCLNTRFLWTRLDSGMSKSWIETYLQRSRGSLLTAFLYEPLSESEKSCELISSCASRWRSLHIDKSHVAEDFGRLCLPELKYLTIDRDVRNDKDIEILGNWDMPKLSHVFFDCGWSSKTMKPNRYFSSETIRSFTFRPSTRYDFVAEASTGLLGSLPNLSELQMDIRIEGSDGGDISHDVTLSKVEYFSLKVRAYNSAYQSMAHLHMPRLVEFELGIKANNYNDEYSNWGGEWQDFVPGRQGALVTDFTLRYNIVNHDGTGSEKFGIRSVFQMFPALEILVLDNPHHRQLVLNYWYTPIAMPPLHTLSVQYTSFDFLAEFASAMKELGRWDGFEFVQVEHLRLLSKQDMEDVINKKRSYDGLESDY